VIHLRRFVYEHLAAHETPHGGALLGAYVLGLARAVGYETGCIGKWQLADKGAVGPVDPDQRGGYEHWLASNVLEFISEAGLPVPDGMQGRSARTARWPTARL
jgi:hypothetical protein